MWYPRPIACILALALASSASAEVRANKVKYLDGTWPAVQKKQAEGKLDYPSSAEAATFTADKKKLGALAIPYTRVTRLSYGHKVTRGGNAGWFAFGPPIVAVAAIGAAATASMLQKNHERFLSIAWTDEQGAPQTATFELGKDVARAFTFNIETRTGKTIEFETPEAKANLGR